MPLTEHPDNDGCGKCDLPLCPFAGKVAIAYSCGVDECTKKVHVECYNRRILPSVGKPPLAPLPDNNVVCTRLHYKALCKIANPSKKLTWNNDAKPETPNVTSSSVLHGWLTTPGNYPLYRGKNNDGQSKKNFCLQICAMINNLTLSVRSPDAVMTMIANLENTWRSCNDWINNTGQGVLNDPLQGQAPFDKAVRKRCFFYYDWEEFMIDRAGNNPAVSSNDLDSASDDGSEDPNEEEEEEEVEEVEEEKKPKAKAKAGKASSVRSRSPAGSVSVIDSQTEAMFSLATSSSSDRMKLMKEQHDVMKEQHDERMAIENRRLKLEETKAASVDWKAKREEVAHKYELYERYNKMKNDGKTDEFILIVLPQAKEIIDALAKTESPKRSPRKRGRQL